MGDTLQLGGEIPRKIKGYSFTAQGTQLFGNQEECESFKKHFKPVAARYSADAGSKKQVVKK
ncbi:MAG: hypothetical protein AAB606_01170 [Patescibacteria group bacterium]